MGPGRLGPGRLGPGRLGPGRLGPGRLGPGRLKAGQFGATFSSKYFPVVMYWNYIWLQNIIPPQKGLKGTRVGSGEFKCGGSGGGDSGA